MSTTKLIISDLHLADGSSILDCFGDDQQAAFEGLLHVAPMLHVSDLARDQVTDTELIINGDCFDFLVTTPYNQEGVIDEQTALDKIARIIAAHRPFFTALRSFVEQPGRSVTFMTGNHDIELCFAQVRVAFCTAIVGQPTDARVHFCDARFYRPLPAVHIEHGNYYDFWNHAIQGLWDEQGQALTTHPETITLPVGSRYFQYAAHPISLHYAYFDHFEPSINSMQQIAWLCLLDPLLVMETAQRTMQLMSSPRQPLVNLKQGEEYVPQRLFEEAMLDFVAFQQDMLAHKADWPAPAASMELSQADLLEFVKIRDALALPVQEALAVLCAPAEYQMGEGVAQGMHTLLHSEPALRYVIAGHTHIMRRDALDDTKTQLYFNTGSWTRRLAFPAPNELSPALVAWLGAPDWQQVPLHDVTQFLFVLVEASDNAPVNADLYLWEGGRDGTYRLLY